MINLEKSLSINYYYFIQRDFYIKTILYLIVTIPFIEILRNQISEINLLQLIPGFYLLLLFSSLVFLLTASNFLNFLSIQLDLRKEIGTKTKNRLEIFSVLKFNFFLFFSSLYFILNLIIPLSLDSFNYYSEKTLENVWSFDEVLNLEILLLFFLIILCQSPFFFLTLLKEETNFFILPFKWKNIFFIFFLLSGLITPTIDGYTQLNYTFSAILFYIIVIKTIQKRLTNKYIGINSLNF